MMLAVEAIHHLQRQVFVLSVYSAVTLHVAAESHFRAKAKLRRHP